MSEVEDKMQAAKLLLRPLVTCGPSGVGKSTLISRLMTEFPTQFSFCVSHTTRAPRLGEIDGVHYHFTTAEWMLKEIEANKFLEWANVHGNYYGTSFASVDSVLQSNRVCILDKDVQGCETLKKANLTAAYVFIRPPSFEALEQRLKARGTDTDEVIARRLVNAKKELMFAESNPGFFDFTVVNDNLDSAYAQLRSSLQSIGLVPSTSVV